MAIEKIYINSHHKCVDMLISGSETAAATSPECRTWNHVSLEEIQRNPRHLCACASAAGLRRHCDILGRMVRESDTSLGSNNYPLLHVAQKFLFCRNDSDAKMPLRKLIDNDWLIE